MRGAVIPLAKPVRPPTLRAMFYVAINRVQSGPFSEAELRQRLAAGAVGPDDLCWQEGWPEWRKIREVFPPAEPPVLVGAPPPLPGENGAASASVAVANTPATSGWAVASFVCGLCVFVLFPLFFLAAPAAIVCGHLAKARLRRAGGAVGGKGLATSGLALGYGGGALLLATSVAIGLFTYRHAQREAEEITVRHQLSQFWSACEQKMLETQAPSVAYDDVVGEGKLLAPNDLKPVAGENYHELVVHQGDESLSITLSDGRTVEFYADSPAGSAVNESTEESTPDDTAEPEQDDAPDEPEVAPAPGEPQTPEAIPESEKEDPEAFLGAPALA